MTPPVSARTFSPTPKLIHTTVASLLQTSPPFPLTKTFVGSSRTPQTTNPPPTPGATSSSLPTVHLPCFASCMERCCRRARSTRRTTLPPRQQLRWLVLLALLLLALAPSCNASRGMQPFRARPLAGGAANHFFGFLPRAPVPPSGPSKGHNAVGLDSQLEKP
jgi:hypothetical protein